MIFVSSYNHSFSKLREDGFLKEKVLQSIIVTFIYKCIFQ